MSNAQEAIKEMLPMITEFLSLLGMSRNGKIDFIKSLQPFSEWISSQEVAERDYAYLVSRVAAYFSYYYVQASGASLHESNGSIQLTLQLGDNVSQTIDPYFFASLVAQKKLTLVQAIDANVS